MDFITTCFCKNIDKLNALSYLFKLVVNTSDTHAYPTRHATRGLFTVPKSITDYGMYYIDP
jgi:hypothetical protein